MESNGQQGKRAQGDAALDGWLDGQVHHYRCRIYYADTDLSGAVYHARYLEMLERGRSDLLRLSDILHSSLEARDNPIFWVVRHMAIDWLRSARIDDVVEIATRVVEVRKARVFMGQRIMRGDEVLVEATVTAALVDPNGKPQRMPREWIDMFAGRQG